MSYRLEEGGEAVPFSPASITVDRTSPVPLYYQVAQELEQAIESGALQPGTRVDNENVLAERMNVSRPTLRRAIEYLVDRGLVVRKRGAGSQVVHPKVRRPIELSSLYDDLSSDGRRPTTKVLSLDPVPAPDAVAHSLGIDEGTPVMKIERLRFAQSEPLALMKNYVPSGLVPLTAEALEQTGLYRLMRAAGVSLHLASQTVGARTATAAEARILHDSRGAPLLTMERTTYDGSGRAVEFGSHIYRASIYSFQFVLATR
jgi:DNA-binding GntR family transcriptional regulator